MARDDFVVAQAWLSFLTDLSGRPVLEEQWNTVLTPTTRALLNELGRHYAPFLVANAEALARGEDRLECTRTSHPVRL